MIMEDFAKPPFYRRAGASGQIIGGKKFLLNNFGIWRRHFPALPIADDEQRHMIAGKCLEIGKQAVKQGFSADIDACFLTNFAGNAFKDSFPFFNAAARKMPSGPVTMTNKEDGVIFAEYNGLRPQCLTAGQTPIGLQYFSDYSHMVLFDRTLNTNLLSECVIWYYISIFRQ